MQAKYLISLCGTSLIAGLLLAIPGAQGAALPADAFPAFDSYIKISGQAPSITGNEAAFQRRLQQNSNGGAGIEELHYTKELSKDTTMDIDGRALFGAEDYLGKFHFSKNEVGSFEAGYKSFRTFYDGIGGFFPLNKQWNALTPEALHVDRGEYWAEIKIALPNAPEFEFKYVNGFRRGQKDDTIWGDTDLTGQPLTLAPSSQSQVRKIVGSYRDLDEHHDTLEGSMKYKLGKTNLRLSLISENTNDIDIRFNTRFPGEVIPWSVAKLSSTNNAITGRSPQNIAKALLTPENWNNQVTFTQTDGMKTDLKGATFTTDTALNDKFSVRTGMNYQDLKSEFNGDRPLYTSTPTAVGVVIVGSNNYLNLAGGSKVKIYTGNIAFDWKPSSDALIQLALRGEDKYTKSVGTLTAVTASANTTTGVITMTNSDQAFNSRVKEKSLTPALDLRYSGLTDLTLYASASVRNVSGDERYQTPTALTSTSIPNANIALNSTSEDRTRITLGANWRGSSSVTLRGELFHKDNKNNSVGYIARSDGFVDNYDLGYKYNGFKLTAIVKPCATLSFSTRYVYQKGQATVTGISVAGTTPATYAVSYPRYDSMDMTNQMIGETIDWTPNKQFYMQANVNVVFNVISTIYPRAGAVPASGALSSWDANQVLQDSNNNYVTGSLVAGAVISKSDNLQCQYTYYRANNYNPQVAVRTQPYGAGAKESIVTIGLKHKFSARMMGNAKVGYCDSKNDTTGGNTNFRGPLAYVALEFAL